MHAPGSHWIFIRCWKQISEFEIEIAVTARESRAILALQGTVISAASCHPLCIHTKKTHVQGRVYPLRTSDVSFRPGDSFKGSPAKALCLDVSRAITSEVPLSQISPHWGGDLINPVDSYKLQVSCRIHPNSPLCSLLDVTKGFLEKQCKCLSPETNSWSTKPAQSGKDQKLSVIAATV